MPWSKLFIVWASSFYWQSLRWQKSKCCRRSPEKNHGECQLESGHLLSLTSSLWRVHSPWPKTIPLSWNQIKTTPPKKNYKTRCRYSYLIPSYSQLFSHLTPGGLLRAFGRRLSNHLVVLGDEVDHNGGTLPESSPKWSWRSIWLERGWQKLL